VRDHFGLDERIGDNATVERSCSADSQMRGLVLYECVVRDEINITGCMPRRVMFAVKLTSHEFGNGFGDLSECNFFMGVHRRTPLGKVKDNPFAPVGHARAATFSNVGVSVDFMYAQIPRISSIAQCLDGRPSEGETAVPLYG
jgi:hypothetical protein